MKQRKIEMKWAFVDYENIGSLSKVDLSHYSKVILFLGAKQGKVDFGIKKYNKPIEMKIIQLKETNSNNLDFHLSYYLGKYTIEAEESITFDVISNDNGFAPLIAHVKANDRSCKQIKFGVSSESKSKPKTKSDFVSKLTAQSINKRPKKVASLKNYIASQLLIRCNEVAVQNHLNRLLAENVIKVSGDDVEYLC